MGLQRILDKRTSLIRRGIHCGREKFTTQATGATTDGYFWGQRELMPQKCVPLSRTPPHPKKIKKMGVLVVEHLATFQRLTHISWNKTDLGRDKGKGSLAFPTRLKASRSCSASANCANMWHLPVWTMRGLYHKAFFFVSDAQEE